MTIPRRVFRYCRNGEIERIEGYSDAIKDKRVWSCHHRLELTMDNKFARSSKDLKRLGMYYDRPYYELILLTRSDHAKLHSDFSDETKLKLKRARKNKIFSKETREKISSSVKGKLKWLHWILDGGKRKWLR